MADPTTSHAAGRAAAVPPEVLAALRRAVRDVREEEPLRAHVSFRIGGPAEVLVVPGSLDELRAACRIALASPVPVAFLGRGSNVLIGDRGIHGVVVKIGAGCDRVEWRDGGLVAAEAGADLPELAFKASRRGWAGLEFAAGIPGSLGGAIVMNAGAHGHSMSEVVRTARAVTADGEIELADDEMRFAYRTSRFQHERALVLGAELALRPEEPAVVYGRLQEWLARRRETQPLGVPSSGCVFRNPPGDHAGRLIDEAGCKRLRVGGAVVSHVHANYVLNDRGATAADVLALAEAVRARVRAHSGAELEFEVKILGEFA